jgi:hypothetical protein
VHRERIESRVRGIPGWHEVGWDHVGRMRAETGQLKADRLVVDAVRPFSENVGLVLDYLGLGE